MDIWAPAKTALRFFNSAQGWVEVQVRRKAGTAPSASMRALVARLYISGEGLELGGLNAPLELPDGVRVRYVDRLPTEELRAHYPDLDMVEVDIIDDGERLESIAESSEDFIVANHFLEHCEDPIRTLGTLTSKLKPGGILYMAVPDADFTFDRDRPSTTFEHLVKDHTEGSQRSREEHLREWVRLVEGKGDEEIEARVRALDDMGYSVHYHVWRMHELLDFLTRTIDELDLQLTMEMAMRHAGEVICVLRRSGSA